MHLYYTDHFDLPLPASHRFPMSKYRLLRQRLVDSPVHNRDVFLVPPAATDPQLLLVHTPDYLDRVCRGELTAAEQRRIGFPWSVQMVERSRRSTGATLAAARSALQTGISVNLAGGTHHSFADAGEGYCVFNDAAVTIRVLQAEGLVERALVVDCDVHQGNGTAAIFERDPTVFTLSLQGERNFPLRKTPSSLDIDLPDGTNDANYLERLSYGLQQARLAGPFQLAIYLAGADPYEGDRLGRLSLTKHGLRERDERVLQFLSASNWPIVMAMAGGYAPQVDDIVDIHATSIATASQLWHTQNPSPNSNAMADRSSPSPNN
jgi:acetoin utilization deacetylase AcuC-like enzyme